MSDPQFFTNKDEWKAARLGLFTASEIHRLLTPGTRPMTDEELAARPKADKGSKTTTVEDHDLLSDGALTYIREKVLEIIAEPKPDFYNSAMEWGNEQEPQAALAAAKRLGYEITDPEFLYCGGSEPVLYTLSTIAACTPDVVTPKVVVEIKCPDSKTHAENLLLTEDTFPIERPDYYSQIQMQLLLTGRESGLFESYDPRFYNSNLREKFIPVKANIDFQKLLLKKLELAKKELDRQLAMYNELTDSTQAEAL